MRASSRRCGVRTPAGKWSRPSASPEAFRACDRQIPLGSLPVSCATAVESFARQPRGFSKPTRGAPPKYGGGSARRRRALGGASPGAASAAATPPPRATQVVRLAAFAPLAARSDLRLLDLQYGDTAAERRAFAAAGGKLQRLDDPISSTISTACSRPSRRAIAS
jgi:hypothetical protein